MRLDAENGFWAKEIVIKIEYKFCPNLTIIDTPGLISAAPGRKNNNLQAAVRRTPNPSLRLPCASLDPLSVG